MFHHLHLLCPHLNGTLALRPCHGPHSLVGYKGLSRVQVQKGCSVDFVGRVQSVRNLVSPPLLTVFPLVYNEHIYIYLLVYIYTNLHTLMYVKLKNLFSLTPL